MAVRLHRGLPHVVAARLRAFFARPKIRHRWEPTTGWLFIAIGIGVAAGS
ncbi:hypothetical protein ACWDE9_29265 [Streptomyces olivaceoviridis]